MIVTKLNAEFKLFMRWRGINIDSQLFDIEFTEPQNFAQYRQAEIDAARIGTFLQLEPVPYLSKRFLMTRYLGMSEMEMKENEIMWKEEQGKTEAAAEEAASLRSVGITPGGIAGDLENVAPEPGMDPGAEAGAPAGAGGVNAGSGTAPGGAGGMGGPGPTGAVV
jgi:hypothetical protein